MCAYLLCPYLLWQMDGVLAGAGAPETAPKAPNLTRSLSGDKPWRMYEESYKQVPRDHQTISCLPLLTIATLTMAVLTMAGAA